MPPRKADTGFEPEKAEDPTALVAPPEGTGANPGQSCLQTVWIMGIFITVRIKRSFRCKHEERSHHPPSGHRVDNLLPRFACSLSSDGG